MKTQEIIEEKTINMKNDYLFKSYRKGGKIYAR